MSGVIEYLPGSRALLSYMDEQGQERSSIVEVVKRHTEQNTVWYAVRARRHVLDLLRNNVAGQSSNPNVEGQWSIGQVEATALRPIGKPTFHIVQ